MNAILKVSDNDNVITCLRALAKGEEIILEGKTYVVKEEIPQFHKMAIENIKKGAQVYKYGQVIGTATNDIREGDYAHAHNIESTRGRGDKK